VVEPGASLKAGIVWAVRVLDAVFRIGEREGPIEARGLGARAGRIIEHGILHAQPVEHLTHELEKRLTCDGFDHGLHPHPTLARIFVGRRRLEQQRYP
jgi:hypothetical protein